MKQTGKIDEIRAREQAATPGPWRWYVNEHSKSMKLLTDHSGMHYVMGFDRYGMQGAQPTFQVYQKYSGPVNERKSRGMVKASELSRWNQDYRHDDGWIEHPDAQLIAHAPEDIRYLLDELAAKDAEIERLNNKIFLFEGIISEDPDIACNICKHGRIENGKEICDLGGCLQGVSWKFDEARFTEGGEQN